MVLHRWWRCAFPYGDRRLKCEVVAVVAVAAGVSGLHDLRSAAVQSLSLAGRFHLLDRDKDPLGLALSIQPYWRLVDETSDVALNHIGWAPLLADRELVPNRIVGAINLVTEIFVQAGVSP